MARIIIYSYVDIVTSSDASKLDEEEFWKHFDEEQKKIEDNWKDWEELDQLYLITVLFAYNRLMAEGRYTDAVDELIIKFS